MKVQFNTPISCWAATADSVEVRRNSASGGIATALGKHFITGRKGVVAGVKWDDNLQPVFSLADKLEELEAFRGSKYVFCKLDKDFISQIRTYVNAGIPVLFIGLPCHVAAIKEMFADNILTVDILCHGTIKQEYFRHELDYLKISEADNISFRENVKDDFHLRIYRQGSAILDIPATKQAYFSAFLNGISLRESCYNCAYARPERISDITIGDFINLGKPYIKDGKTCCVKANDFSGNVSFCSLNTQNGQKLFNETEGILSAQRDYEERLSYRPSLLCSTKRPVEDKVFRLLLPVAGYPRAIRVATRILSIRKMVLNQYVGLKRKLGINGSLFCKKH